jgi:hypothetical protein
VLLLAQQWHQDVPQVRERNTHCVGHCSIDAMLRLLVELIIVSILLFTTMKPLAKKIKPNLFVHLLFEIIYSLWRVSDLSRSINISMRLLVGSCTLLFIEAVVFTSLICLSSFCSSALCLRKAFQLCC